VGPNKGTGVGSFRATGKQRRRSLDGAAGKCLSGVSIEPWRPVMRRVFLTLPPEITYSDAKNFSRSKGVLRFKIM
jgi:hypothetical protein